MIKTVLKIDGMACSMCESHVNDAIRGAFDVKKVSSSHSNGEAEIISETYLPQDKLREAIEKTGYRVLDVSESVYEKKGFFSKFRK